MSEVGERNHLHAKEGSAEVGRVVEQLPAQEQAHCIEGHQRFKALETSVTKLSRTKYNVSAAWNQSILFTSVKPFLS